MGEPVADYEIPKIFSLTFGLKPAKVPTDDVLIKHAQEILDASTAWREGKTYANTIATSLWEEQPKGPDSNNGNKKAMRWYCLVAKIKKDDISFNKLWAKLGKNQVWHQQSVLTSLAKVTRVQYISEQNSIWTTLVTSPPPLSPRVYTNFQAGFLLEYSHNRRGIIVTLPIDLSSQSTEHLAHIEESGTRGRFVSIEHIQEMDEDAIEWRKITCKDPGGMIPKFWAQKHMAHEMAEENISFLIWIEKIRDEEGHDSEEDIAAPR